MKNSYIKRISAGFVLGSVFALNGFYFLLTTQPMPDNTIILNLPEQFSNQEIPYLTMTRGTLELTVSIYDYWIRGACQRYSLDPALVKAVIQAESNFDPLAVSSQGAVGLMQINPITVKELGIKDPFDPKHNIDGGVRYLRELLDTFEGNQKLALAAYNAGPSRVYQHNGVPPYKHTKNYIKQVFRYLSFYQKTG